MTMRTRPNVQTIVAPLGIYLSVKLDLPTGATMVCTFGLVLIVMAAVRPLLFRRSRAEAPVPAPVAVGEQR